MSAARDSYIEGCHHVGVHWAMSGPTNDYLARGCRFDSNAASDKSISYRLETGLRLSGSYPIGDARTQTQPFKRDVYNRFSGHYHV